jgi:hypothetical protein
MRILRYLCAGFIAALLGIAGVNAATTPNSFITTQVPNIGITTFAQGVDSPGTYKTIYTGATNGSKCYSLTLSHDDQNATHLVTLRLVHSATTADMAIYTTVTGGPANLFSTPANLFSAQIWPGLPSDAYGNGYIILTNGDTLRATFAAAITSGDTINITAFCSDF